MGHRRFNTVLAVAALAILAAGSLAFRGAAGAGGAVSLEDFRRVRDNRLISAPVTFDRLTAILLLPHDGEYRPVTLLSCLADNVTFAALGLPPLAGMHTTGILLHLANSLLAALLALLVLEDLAPGRLGETGRIFVASFTGLYFALHPMHVEPVAWLSGRAYLLSFFFAALSFLAFRRYVRKGGAARAAASAGLFLLALGAETIVLTLPLAAGAYWLLIGRPGGRRGALLLALMSFASLGAAAIRHLLIAQGGYAAEGVAGSAAGFLTAVKVFPFYMRAMLFPVNLSAVYGLAPASGLADGGVWWGALLIAVQIAVAAFVRAKPARFIVLWYLLFLAPALLLPARTSALAADRLVYPASFSFALAPALLAWHVRSALVRRGAIPVAALLTAASVVYAGVLGTASHSRVRVWRSSLSLWTDVLGKNPRSALALAQLGRAYMDAGDAARAKELLRRAVRSDAGFLSAYNALALAYEQEGLFGEARILYTRSLGQRSSLSRNRTRHERASAYFGLARLCFAEDKFLTARALAERALGADPEIEGPAALYRAADGRIKQLRRISDERLAAGDEALSADPLKAERFYLQAAEAAVEYPAPRERLTDLYFRAGRWSEAFENAVLASGLGADGAVFEYQYGVSALHMKRYQIGAERLSRALILDPSMTNAKVKLAVARAYLGQPAQALLILKEVLDRDPSNTEARDNFNAIKAALDAEMAGTGASRP